MEESTDPNVPDTSNGDFFCRLCLASANSEGMWVSHIAGKRHIKNMQKFPNGKPQRLDDDDDEFERPAKYRRYENDDYPDYPPRDKYYRRTTDYVPEIRPQVIDYGHKTILAEETSQPDSRRFEGIPLKEKPEDLIDKIFAGTKFDRKKKHFEEESSKKQADERIQRKWNSNNLKQRCKGMLYDDDFEKELDELLQNSSDHKGFKQKDRETFCKDKFKKQVDDLLLGKSRNRESEHRDVIILSDDDDDDDSKNYANHKNTNKRKIVDHGISKMKETEGKDKKMYDRESDKRYSKKKDKDFVDIFHKINDQKLFTMSVADEPESRSSVKKSAKAVDSKLDDFDPDKLTPDAVDDLLTSYLKPKAGSSKVKESLESLKESVQNLVKNSAESEVKDDDPDIIARKLEILPTKSFFQIIIKRLEKIDLKDSDELKMLLEVIAQAQAVACKKLPPHLQAVIKAKMSQNDSKTAKALSASVQSPILPQTNYVPTVLPQSTTQTVGNSVLQPVAQSVPSVVSSSVAQSIPSISRPVAQSVPNVVSYPVQPLVSYPASQSTSATPTASNTLDSLQSMLAWQNYLQATSQSASEKRKLNVPNSVQDMIAYHNYLSNLQAGAQTASKMTSKSISMNPGVVNTLPNSNTAFTSLQKSTSSTQLVPRAVPRTTSVRPVLNAVNSTQNMVALQNFLSTVQTTPSKTVPKTPHNSSLIQSTSSSTFNFKKF